MVLCGEVTLTAIIIGMRLIVETICNCLVTSTVGFLKMCMFVASASPLVT